MSETFLNIDILRHFSILCQNIFLNYSLVINTSNFSEPEKPELNSTPHSNNTYRHTCTYSLTPTH